MVSHYDTNVTPDYGVEFLTEEPLQRVYELKQTHDILVVGGGKLITSLIEARLLDSLTIYTVPVMGAKASVSSVKRSARNGSCRKAEC